MQFICDARLSLRKLGDGFIAYHGRSGETVILHDLAFQTLEILKLQHSFDSVYSLLDLTNNQFDSEKSLIDFVRSVFDEMLKHRFIHEVEL